jgi:hypothetical protein
MASGSALSSQQVKHAIHYNHGLFNNEIIKIIQNKLRLSPENGHIDEALVRAVADWQEAQLGIGRGNGTIDPATEANLNILEPQAQRAVDEAIKMQRAGGILFDSWGNDLRDNNSNDQLDQDDVEERNARDGDHYERHFSQFQVLAGTFEGGWPGFKKYVTVHLKRTIRGHFRYRVCADLISEAYHKAHIIRHVSSVYKILNELGPKAFQWRRSVSYPTQYLPGDFICSYDEKRFEGHAALVVEEGPTDGGSTPPMILDLPGPSSQISDGTYDPTETNDIEIHKWPKRRLDLPTDTQYLLRVLHSKLHHHGHS